MPTTTPRIGERKFNEQHVAWIALMDRLRRTSMSIAEVYRCTHVVKQGKATLRKRASNECRSDRCSPVSRGDIDTVAGHGAAMAALGDSTLRSYRLLCGRTVPLALARGSIDAPTAAQLHRLLEGPSR
jgi:predicted short-subunit dehydrogenase-like oxidoreductase (DUF2520 family)